MRLLRLQQLSRLLELRPDLLNDRFHRRSLGDGVLDRLLLIIRLVFYIERLYFGSSLLFFFLFLLFLLFFLLFLQPKGPELPLDSSAGCLQDVVHES